MKSFIVLAAVCLMASGIQGDVVSGVVNPARPPSYLPGVIIPIVPEVEEEEVPQVIPGVVNPARPPNYLPGVINPIVPEEEEEVVVVPPHFIPGVLPAPVPEEDEPQVLPGLENPEAVGATACDACFAYLAGLINTLNDQVN